MDPGVTRARHAAAARRGLRLHLDDLVQMGAFGHGRLASSWWLRSSSHRRPPGPPRSRRSRRARTARRSAPPAPRARAAARPAAGRRTPRPSQPVDGRRRLEHRGPGRAGAHGVGGDAGAGQVGGQRPHQADDRVLRRAVPLSRRSPSSPAADATATKRPCRGAGAASRAGTAAAASCRTPFTFTSKSDVPLRVGRLPQRRAARRRPRPPPPRRRARRSGRGRRHRGVDVRPGGARRPPPAHRSPWRAASDFEVGPRRQRVGERRLVGAAVDRDHLPSVGHQQVHGRGPDPPRRRR